VYNCKLCQKNPKLKKSHAIPDTFFRQIFKEDSGKSIVVSSAVNVPIINSSDSWATNQLCNECERKLNENYEDYSIKVIRGKNTKRDESGVTFSNLETMNFFGFFGFFASVFWRAANSEHEAYSKIISPEPWNEELRKCLYNNDKIPENLLSIKLSKLIDYTANDGLTLEDLRKLIMSPFSRKSKEKKYSFCFVFGGFFIEIFTPALKHIDGNKVGVLKCSKPIFIAPFLDIYDVPEIKENLLQVHGEDES